MIRRYFLRILAFSPLAGLAADPARGGIAARSAGQTDMPDYPGRTILAARMLEIWELRKKYDDARTQWAALEADISTGWRSKYRQKADPLIDAMCDANERIVELERSPIPMDCLLGDPEIRPDGALARVMNIARSGDDIVNYSIVGIDGGGNTILIARGDGK